MRLLLTLALLASLTGTVLADTLVDVYVDGAKKNLQPQARVRDGVTYAPLRAAGNAVGADIKWDAQAQAAIVCAGTTCTRIKKSQGIIVNDSLLIPLRLMAEAVGADVKWDGAAKAVRISTPPDEGTMDEGTG